MHTGGRWERRAPVALSALQNQVLLPVAPAADGAGGQAGAGGTLGVVVLPLAPRACRRGSTVSAPHAPATQHTQASARLPEPTAWLHMDTTGGVSMPTGNPF